jgi:hypothetical protein
MVSAELEQQQVQRLELLQKGASAWRPASPGHERPGQAFHTSG